MSDYGYRYDPEATLAENVAASTLWDRWRAEHAPGVEEMRLRALDVRVRVVSPDGDVVTFPVATGSWESIPPGSVCTFVAPNGR